MNIAFFMLSIQQILIKFLVFPSISEGQPITDPHSKKSSSHLTGMQ